MIRKLLSVRLVRYLVMASAIVALELALFYILTTWLNVNYLIATPLTMLNSIVLNWHFSHRFVFSGRIHTPHKEFMLVLAASIVGVVLQILITAFCVETLKLLPIVGKTGAIAATFFWNYWFRRRYVFAA